MSSKGSGNGGTTGGLLQSLLRMPIRFLFLGFVFVAVIGLISILGTSAGGPHHVELSAEDALTVTINTFKRNDLLTEAVNHYANCPVVKYIVVVWSEQTPPSPALVDKFNRISSAKVKLNGK